jgi:hypothetical protein
MTVNELIINIQRLDAPDFEELAEKIQQMRPHRPSHKVADHEQRLIQKIASAIPRNKQMHFEYLIALRDIQNISTTEYEELLSLTAEIEKYDLLRLRRMARLAKIKKITLSEVAELFNKRNSR